MENVPDIIINATDGSVIIHDLRRGADDPGLYLPPEPQLFYIKDVFGVNTCKGSMGLQYALEHGLVKEVKPGDEESALAEARKNKVSLREKLEEVVGKIPTRKKSGEKNEGIKDPALQQAVREHIQKGNIFDTKLADLREELKHDILE